MKTLKESILAGIKESLLSDMEDTLSVDNAYKKAYPVPKVRDFQKGYWGGTQVDWICPGLIQEYINILDSTVIGITAKEHAVGFRISIRGKYELIAYIIDNNGSYSSAIELTGIGGDGASIPNQKKEIIEFFNYIQNNPSELKKLFAYVNKRQEELNTKGECDCWTLKRILKY